MLDLVNEYIIIVEFYNDNLMIDNDIYKKLFKLFDNEVENLLKA